MTALKEVRHFVNQALHGDLAEPVKGSFTGSPRVKALKAAITVGMTTYKSLRNGMNVQVTATPEEEQHGS